MKRILIITGAILAILIAALIIVPFLVPTSVYKTQIEAAASTALDRKVTLKGSPSLSILPIISARVDGVEVANPEGFSDPLMIEAGSLRASVKLLPLLSRRVEIAQITLNDATVRLERLADGRANWEFAAADEGSESTPPADGSSGLDTGIDRAALSNAAVYYRDWTTDTQYALTDFSATARLSALDKPLDARGSGQINGQAFDFDVNLKTIAALTEQQPVDLSFKLGTIYGDVAYDGSLRLADMPELDGAFDLKSDTIGQALSVIGAADLPIVASTLKSVQAAGTVRGPADTAALDFSTLKLAATGLALDYTGGLTLGATPTLDGVVAFNAADAQRLLKPGHELIPILTLLGDVDFEATLSGAATAPTLTGIKLKQRGQNLIADYSGNFSLSGEQALDGTVSISSDNPRAVLAVFGTELADGTSLNKIAVSGDTKGSALAPSLSNARFTIDETIATGTVGADLRGARPRIIADLSTQSLDLTPFLGSGSQQQDTTPSLDEDWDDTPLDLASLNAVDATVTIAASEILLDQIALNDARLNTRLDAGRLSAIFRQANDQPGFKVFQGNWSGDLVLDASGTTPTLKIEALADSIAAQEMLTALTGFQNLRGLGDVHLDMTSEGNSLKALISGLDGKFESDLERGALKGLNLAKLVRDGTNLRDLLGSGNLTIASFRDAFSPEAETDFSKFIGNLEFSNGVASITDLSIDNSVVGISGAGSIDLAARTLDIRLTPRVDLAAAGAGSTIGLGNIPIPVRISGSWANVKYGLDSSAVQAELTSRLRGQAASRIGEQIGGDAGSIIGGIIGGNSNQSDPDEATPDLEDELRDRALDALFGNRNPASEPAEEAAPD